MTTARLPLLALLAALLPVACRSAAAPCCDVQAEESRSAAPEDWKFAVLGFQHLDAALAANTARQHFGVPPMHAEVQLQVDASTNTWLVSATRADMLRVQDIAVKLDAAAGFSASRAPTQTSDTEPSADQVRGWLARRNVQVIHFEHQDAALAANAARQHLGAPDVAEPVILLVDRDANSWIALADPRDREHVRAIAARYDRADGPSPRTR